MSNLKEAGRGTRLQISPVDNASVGPYITVVMGGLSMFDETNKKPFNTLKDRDGNWWQEDDGKPFNLYQNAGILYVATVLKDEDEGEERK